MPELQPLQRVGVREEDGAPSSEPDDRWLGKEGTIQHGTGLVGGPSDPPSFYFVEFDNWPFLDKVFAISPYWLEPRVTLRKVKEQGSSKGHRRAHEG